MQSHNTFADSMVVSYKNVAREHDYYRLYLYPIDPSPEYSIDDNGKLAFSFMGTNYSYAYGSIIVEQNTHNFFNVKAMLANSYRGILDAAKARGFYHSESSPVLVVDIPKLYLDQKTEVRHRKYEYNSQCNKNFFPTIQTQLEDYHLVNNLRFDFNQPVATPPIYNQIVNTSVKYDDLLISLPTTNTTYTANSKNELLENGDSHAEVYDYTDESKNLGKDIYLSANARPINIAYRREVCGVAEWYSHMADNNRWSYARLTRKLHASENAVQIANLFSDYARKGEGLSALLHFHLFRHAQNVQQAKIIAADLKSEKYKNASNLEIAKYLLEQYDLVSQSYKDFNPEGSFARRTRYAIMQLTEGLCPTIQQFREMLSQFEAKNEDVAQLGMG